MSRTYRRTRPNARASIWNDPRHVVNVRRYHRDGGRYQHMGRGLTQRINQIERSATRAYAHAVLRSDLDDSPEWCPPDTRSPVWDFC